MRDKSSFVQDCQRIIAWRNNKITPQQLFALPEANYVHESQHRRPLDIKYNEREIKQAYRQQSLKFHPDKNEQAHREIAQEAFDVITAAKDYLLYTIKKNNVDISNNIFYLYYHADVIANATKEDRLENIIKEGYRLKNISQSLEFTVFALKKHLSQHPALVNYECDDSNWTNVTTGGKSILYAAAQWNEPGLFSWLLDQGADPLAKTNFGMSPLDIAITREHLPIIDILAQHESFGEHWIKTELFKLFSDNEVNNQDQLLTVFLRIFPTEYNAAYIIEQFPVMIPALHHHNMITAEEAYPLYKTTIIGHPKLYACLNKTEQSDKFMIIATMSQDRSFDTMTLISQQNLEPAFITAVCDIWPDAIAHLNPTYSEFHPNYGKPKRSNLTTFNDLKNTILITALSISLVLIAYHFWPIIALFPGVVLLSFVLPIGAASISLGVAGSLRTATTGYEYLTKVYPETKAIRRLLVENNFFKPSTPPDTDPEPHTLSQQPA